MRWLIVLCCIGCAEDTKSKPEPPDMAALVEAYARPTRGFDAAAAVEIQNLVESKVRALVDLDKLAARFDEALAALGVDDKAALAPTRSIVLEGEGFARIERICTGYGTPAPPVDKAVNGYLDLTVGYSESGLDPVVFGGAVDCREQVADTELAIGGDVHLFIGDNVKVDQLATSPILFELANFAFDVDGARVVSGGFDFQVCRGSATACVPDHVEVLLGLGSGTLVVFFDVSAKTGGFRAANGMWTCNFTGGTCTDETGNTVAIPVYQL